MSLVTKYQILPPIYPILEQIGDSDSKKMSTTKLKYFYELKDLVSNEPSDQT